jgi:hypothetical protein
MLRVSAGNTGVRGVNLVLSHRERRILLGIERQLRAEDPELDRKFRSRTTVRRASWLRLGAGVLALAAAVSILFGAPLAAPSLLTFATTLFFMSYLPH